MDNEIETDASHALGTDHAPRRGPTGGNYGITVVFATFDKQHVREIPQGQKLGMTSRVTAYNKSYDNNRPIDLFRHVCYTILEMSQSEKMKKALLQYVVPGLIEHGFDGEYPHYKRENGDSVDIISFFPYKYGNAFVVVVSTYYPDRPKETSNIFYPFFDGDFDKITADDCRAQYRLKGNFDGAFFYTDVYFHFVGAFHMGVSDKKAETYKKGFLEFRVQKAGPDIYEKVCYLVNKQLPKAYKWLDKFGRK